MIVERAEENREKENFQVLCCQQWGGGSLTK